jgi:cytochrome c1
MRVTKSISKLVLGVVAATTMYAGTGHAELKTQGEGKAQTLVRSQFSAALQPAYDTFASHCTKCHEMARPISALRTGITPISGGQFDAKGIRDYVVKMMRKPNSGITKDDAKDIIEFLRQARDLAAK